LSAEQYAGILAGVPNWGRTRDLHQHQAEPTPDQRTVAGVGGGRLFPSALKAVRTLTQLKQAAHASLDVIACGGVLDGRTYDAYARRGVVAMQYWSAMVYRSPLAAALILNERKQMRIPYSEQVAQALIERAFGYTPDQPITFKSGILSPVYIDNPLSCPFIVRSRTVITGVRTN
jgi:hypothetical protein